MKSWQEKLNEIPAKERNNKKYNELFTLIIVQFLQEDVYPRLEEVKSDLSDKNLSIDIFPKFKDEISVDNQSVRISINKDQDKILSLTFDKGESTLLNITLKLGDKLIPDNFLTTDIDSPRNTRNIESSILKLCNAAKK